jgi:hypothetical protein
MQIKKKESVKQRSTIYIERNEREKRKTAKEWQTYLL